LPLRPGNPDFRLLGHPLAAVVAFSALALFHGMVLTSVAAKLSSTVPLLPSRKAIPAHVPVIVLLLPLLGGIGPLLGLPILAGIVVLSLTVPRRPKLMSALKSRRTRIAGRVALAAGGLAFLPGFVSDLTELLSRA